MDPHQPQAYDAPEAHEVVYQDHRQVLDEGTAPELNSEAMYQHHQQQQQLQQHLHMQMQMQHQMHQHQQMQQLQQHDHLAMQHAIAQPIGFSMAPPPSYGEPQGRTHLQVQPFDPANTLVNASTCSVPLTLCTHNSTYSIPIRATRCPITVLAAKNVRKALSS